MGKAQGWKPYWVALVIVFLLLLYTQLRERRYEQTVEHVFKSKADRVVSYAIAKGSSSVGITRVEAIWRFQLPDTGKVDTARVGDFLSKVMTAQRESYVTEDTTRYDRYGLASETALRVDVRIESGEIETIFVGRSRTDSNREYVRFPGDPRVYLMHESVLRYLGPQAGLWRE